MHFQCFILIISVLSLFHRVDSTGPNKTQMPTVNMKKEDASASESVSSLPLTKTIPEVSKKGSPRVSSQATNRRRDANNDNNQSNDGELLKRSPTNHNPYSHGTQNGHSPYVDMVFRLAAEAVEASDASQKISNQFSSNHGHQGRAMHVKAKVPLYKQSYPVLFQHGHIMHSPDGGLPYPYIPTMKSSGAIIRQPAGADDNYGNANSPVPSYRMAEPAYGQRTARKPHNTIY